MQYLHYQLGKRAVAGGDPRSALADFRLALGDHSLLAPLAAAGELVALLLLDDHEALRDHLTDPEHEARRAAFRRRTRDGEMQAAGVEVASLIGDDRLDPGAGRRGLAALYERHVAGYVVKSKPLESFTDAMNMIDHYWRVVELP